MDNQKSTIVNVSDAVIKGTRYEHLFIANALERGLVPETPSVPMPWDFTITRLDDLTNIRVQVKGTNTKTKDNRFAITSKTGSRGHQPIDSRVVHVLACYVEPFSCWYCIPTTALAGKSVWLYPHREGSAGGYECWRHDWSYFKT